MKPHGTPRIVVIGTGSIAVRFHLPALQHLARTGRCVLAAVCDLNGRAAAVAARKFGAHGAYTDFHAMLKAEEPDGVVVLTPVPATAPVAGAILRRGYAVLLEKPPGDSVRACRSIIRAAEVGRARNMVAFNRRYCPQLVQAKAEALKHAPIKGASARMYRHARDDDDFFFGTGIHSLDALRFLAGDMDAVQPGKRVLARGERPTFTTFIEYANGGIGTYVARPQAGLNIERYEIFARESIVLVRAGIFPKFVDGSGECLLYERNQPVRLPDPLARFRSFRGDLRAAAVGGFFGEQERFVMALHGKAVLEPMVADTLQSVEIAEAVQAGRRWRRNPR